MPISVRIGFDTAMKTGSSRRLKRYPTTYMWVSSCFPLLWIGLSWFFLILSKGKPTWNSHIGCRVSFESSWWARFHSSAKTFADLVWHSSKIWKFWPGRGVFYYGLSYFPWVSEILNFSPWVSEMYRVFGLEFFRGSHSATFKFFLTSSSTTDANR